MGVTELKMGRPRRMAYIDTGFLVVGVFLLTIPLNT